MATTGVTEIEFPTLAPYLGIVADNTATSGVTWDMMQQKLVMIAIVSAAVTVNHRRQVTVV